jgi:predicted nucleic acid-binding protein
MSPAGKPGPGNRLDRLIQHPALESILTAIRGRPAGLKLALERLRSPPLPPDVDRRSSFIRRPPGDSFFYPKLKRDRGFRPSLYGEDCNSRLKKVKAEMNAQKPRGLDFFYTAHWVAIMKGTARNGRNEKRESKPKIWYTKNGGEKMKKPRIYLDTSVINFYFAEDAPEKMAVTRKFFDEELASGNYETYISLLVLDELEETKDQALRDKLVALANQYITEVFPLTDEVNAIAAKFVEEGIVPEKYKDDGLHLALALTNNIDYIVSWNFKHIVKLKTKRAVKAFSIKEGYKEIEITTPQEVVENED